MTLALLDRTVAISSPSNEVIDALDWFGAPARTREPAGERYELTLDPAELRTLPSRLNRLAAASTAFVVLHAAGVVFGDRVVALPAGPGAGKSTLATRLVVDGAGYLTDEVLGIAPGSLAVAGYPKRITLELGSWPLFPELDGVADRAVRDGFDPTRVRWLDARDLHPAAFAWRGRALGLGLIVVPQFRAGAELSVDSTVCGRRDRRSCCRTASISPPWATSAFGPCARWPPRCRVIGWCTAMRQSRPPPCETWRIVTVWRRDRDRR